MYSIYTLDSKGGQCIYNDKYPLEAYAVKSPTLKMVDSSAGSLEMTLPPTNRAYETLKRMKTQIVVKRYDEEIWEGRVVEDTYDFQNNRKVYCEGALAYFNDTCQPQCEYKTTTLTLFLQSVINIHNSKVPDSRKIYFDYQNVDSGVIDYKATQYQKTLEVLNSVCEEYGCHMQLVIKRVQTGTSVDPDTQEETPIYERRRLVRFFKGVIGSSAQTVEFGKNLLEYSKNYDLSSLATVVLPLGAKKERSNTSQTGEPIDLTTAIEYTSDLGYGVIKTYSDGCTLQTEDFIREHQQGPYIWDHNSDQNKYPGHYVAVLKVKASTAGKPSTVYISSRMYGGMGMYFFCTPSANNDYEHCQYYGGGKFASTSTGFTDCVDASVTVPSATAEHAEDWYWLFVGSFGGDIALRVNKPAEVSDNLDEYYTVEDALVSSINLVSTIPTIEYGKIYCQGETNPGGTYADDNYKFIRTTNFIQPSNGGNFGEGKYSVRIATNNNHSIQARVIQYQSDGTFVASTDWISLPGRFDVTYTNGVKLKLMFKYGDTTQDFVLTGTDAFSITAFEIVKGEKFGNLYVTSQSRNLFNAQIEQGNLIDEGTLIGMPGGSSNLSMRTVKLLGRVDPTAIDGENVTATGFTDDHTYLLSGKITQPDPNFTRGILCRIFFYDMDDDHCIGIFHDEGTDPSTDKGWGPIPRKFTVPQTCRLKFEFKYQHDSPISYAGLTDIMLEEDANLPSMYEPPNTSFEEYGWIETAITWDDVSNPDDLYYRAKSYLASGQFDKMTLSVTALDLSVLGADPGKIELNNYIRVTSAPHGLDKYFEITEIDIPLSEPDSMKFQLGSETQQTFTSINNNQIGELVTKVDNQTSISKMIDAARKNAEAIIETGFTSGKMVTITNQGTPSGLAFFREWNQAHTQTQPYSGQIPSSEWSDIISDSTMSEVMCLYINTEGIAFYGNGLGSSSTITLTNGLGQIVADSILAGTMVAERIVGGTLHLGLGPGEEQSADAQDESGKLYAHCKDPDQLDVNNHIKFLDNDRMVEMTKDVGIVQQGYNTDDGYTRQVRIDKGVIEGSVMYDSEVHLGDDKYHVGGLIRMATKWDHNQPYGIEISAPNGPMVFSPCSAGIAVLSTNGQGNYGWGYNQSTTIDGVTLHFTHGLLTSVTGSGGGGGGSSEVTRSEFDNFVVKHNALVDYLNSRKIPADQTTGVACIVNAKVDDLKY